MGQSTSSGCFASKSLKLAVFGKSVSSGLDLGLSVRAVEATASAWERCLADCERNGLELLAAPKQVNISGEIQGLQLQSWIHIRYKTKLFICAVKGKIFAPGWARTTNLSVNSRTR